MDNDPDLFGGPGSPGWEERVDRFGMQRLLPVLSRRLSATVTCADGSRFPAIMPDDAGSLNEAEGDAGDVLLTVFANLLNTLKQQGVHPGFTGASPYEYYLSGRGTFNAARRLANSLRPQGEGKPAEDGDMPQIERIAYRPHRRLTWCPRLVPNADIAERTIQMAGIQLQPILVWDSSPAPSLRSHLESEVLRPGTRTPWDALLGAHHDATIRLADERQRTTDDLYQARCAHSRSEKVAKLERIDQDILLEPLTTPQLVAISVWSRDNCYQIQKRYRTQVLQFGMILDHGSLRNLETDEDET